MNRAMRSMRRFLYRYDFGDDWEHDITVERVESGGDPTLRCTGGARACPPEDCGGPHGYAHLLAVLADRKHEEHAEMKQWAPRGFDPEKFDPTLLSNEATETGARLRFRDGARNCHTCPVRRETA
jgi:hypothetical protein